MKCPGDGGEHHLEPHEITKQRQPVGVMHTQEAYAHIQVHLRMIQISCHQTLLSGTRVMRRTNLPK